MDFPLVSIIIPTFNRAHLIRETLDSIIAQSYTNWECIVVDDGSNDGTDSLLVSYCHNDKRFKYLKRPKHHMQGGNGARNYGFTMSKGDYIQWFDSDDVMHPDFVKLKVRAFQEYGVDIVISKSKLLNKEQSAYGNYDFKSKDINVIDFATTSMSWLTPDIMIKRSFCELVEFDESLKAGQEYNFICKLLTYTNSNYVINEYLTQVRENENSIGSNRFRVKEKYLKTKFDVYWKTYYDLNIKINSKDFNQYMLLKCISAFYESKNQLELPKEFQFQLKKVFGNKVVYFYLGKYCNRYFGKYYVFYELLKS
ncbi:MAG: hypothetical protein Tsb0033_25640 [Winogradskyella sp.]